MAVPRVTAEDSGVRSLLPGNDRRGDNGWVTNFQVWAGNLQGQEFDEHSSYTVNPVTGVLTIHWADGRTSHYSPSTWQRIEDQSTCVLDDRGVI